MEFQLRYFKSWKMMLWEYCTQYTNKFGKLSSGHRTGKGQFSLQSQRKAMPKNAQATAQLHSSHTLVRSVQFSSITKSCPTLWTPWITVRQAFLSTPTPGAHSNSCPSSQWCHPAISSSVFPFSSCPQSLPASVSFSMNQLFTGGGQILEFQLQHQSFQWTLRTDLV